jgi:hypothetical protein
MDGDREGLLKERVCVTEGAGFFTVERIAEIRESAVEARTGGNISLDELRAEMKNIRTEGARTEFFRADHGLRRNEKPQD